MSTLIVGSGVLRVHHLWADLKVAVAAKSLLLQYVEDASSYTFFAPEGSVVHTSTIWKDGAPVTGIPEGNAADLADFEANFKAGANKPLDLRAADGRAVTRVTVATPGRSTHLRSFNFLTANKDSLVCKSPTNEDYTDVTMKLYDADGAETTNNALAVKTVLDFEAHYDQEMVGGGLLVDKTLLGAGTRNWWGAAIAAPDIPAQYGGSIAFVSKVDLEMIPEGHLHIDGRSTMYIPYDSTNHSGVIRFNFWYPVGEQKAITVYLETFR